MHLSVQFDRCTFFRWMGTASAYNSLLKMTQTIFRFLVVLYFILYFQSCSSKVMGIKIDDKKTSYTFIQINEKDYLVRVLESESAIFLVLSNFFVA